MSDRLKTARPASGPKVRHAAPRERRPSGSAGNFYFSARLIWMAGVRTCPIHGHRKSAKASKTAVFGRALTEWRSKGTSGAPSVLWVAASPPDQSAGVLAMTDIGARPGGCDRPEIQRQSFEKIELAPGFRRQGPGRRSRRPCGHRQRANASGRARARDERPQNLSKPLENVEFRAGTRFPPEASAIAARSSRLRDVRRCIALRTGGGGICPRRFGGRRSPGEPVASP